MSDKEKLLAFIVGGVFILIAFAMVKDGQEKAGQERIINRVIDRVPNPCSSEGCRDYRKLVKASVPYLDLPQEFRVDNYAGGSCVHACTETLLYWQGCDELAAWWKRSYSGGEYSERLHRRLDAAGVRYAYTTTGDWAFLERCVRLRLGCAVNWPSGHMVTLVGIDADYVYMIDNNATQKITKRTRELFAKEWSGWATTIVYLPPPPKPYALTQRTKQ